MKKFILFLSVFGALITMGFSFSAEQAQAQQVGSDFQANRIIDDNLFYNGNELTVQQIQQFLNARVPVCDTSGSGQTTYRYNASPLRINGNDGSGIVTHPNDPFVTTSRAVYGDRIAQRDGESKGSRAPFICLKDFVTSSTPAKSDSGLCGPLPAQTNRTAAQIIDDVARACNISQKVLLVMLEKEQSLLSDTWPWGLQYNKAMGYYCPDDPNRPGWCAPEYAGFFNQVYNAARQFQRYRQQPQSFNHALGRTSYVAYQANAPGCGGTNLTMQTAATAGLYNYTPYQPNQAALNPNSGPTGLYGSGNSCSAYGNRNFWRMFRDWFGSTYGNASTHTLSRAYVNGAGWTNFTSNSSVIGTTGQNRYLEAISIQGEVAYSVYTEQTGWQPSVNQGMIAGSLDMSRPIKGVKINLLGRLSDRYDIYYRAHVSNVGWMDWTRNGLPAGISGLSNNVEAVEINLVPKYTNGPALGSDSYRNNESTPPVVALGVNITSHVSIHGWQPTVKDAMVSGTLKQKLAIESIKMSVINNTAYSGGIVYSTHLAGTGWQNYRGDGVASGTIGQSRQMEAIRIGLTGALSSHYDIYYRAHVQGYGWLGWTRNNEPAGTSGEKKRLESIEVRIVEKGSIAAPLMTNSPFSNPENKSIPDSFTLTYSVHAKDLGWLPTVSRGQIAGTVEQSRRLEAIRVDNFSSVLGSIGITCTAYVQDIGWIAPQNMTANAYCGTIQQSKSLQAVKLALNGEATHQYNITYSVHVANIGWTQWLSSDEVAGTVGANQIEAIRINLTEIN